MSRLPFLLEIGTEEIPDWMIVSALEQLQILVQSMMDGYGLLGRITWAEATPRRLALHADGIIGRQPDGCEEKLGPPKSAGPKAAESFAKRWDSVGIVETEKGEYYIGTKQVKGQASRDILASELPGLILKIQWPKAMYWTGKNGPRFIRPIRWLVALLGGDVVPFEIAGVQSGNITRGHRTSGHGKLGSASIPVTIENYEQSLDDNRIILSAAGRRDRIEKGIETLLDNSGLHRRNDEALLQTLVYITEYPTPIIGSFDEQYLELPSEVLVTVMKHHQKYFSVEDAAGQLAPRFIAVMNTNADPEGLVRRGNERVLRARFNDARFFWQMDQQKKLAERVADLANVTFQAKLGSYLEKTKRTVDLARELAQMAAINAAPAERAAMLLKADLTTEMVKEFTELQGVVGGLYAKAQGEPDDVWRAIYDHYKPASMEDSIPSSAVGRLVALADKLDTLRGCFGVGLMPTGSKDPFALRRAAQGVVRILVEGKLEFPLSKLSGGDQQLLEFLLDRIRYYFREVRGFAYDEVNAVLASGSENLPDIEARLTALKAVRPTENFEPLAASFKRMKNILVQAGFKDPGFINANLLEPGPEFDLYNAFQMRKHSLESAPVSYLRALETIASMRPAVDLFFDKVLVNAPDADVRRRRLTLLHDILNEFSTIADFSEIVTQ